MSEKILIADSDRDKFLLVADILQVQDYEVVAAYDGESALQKAFQEQPDLIILEVMMPDMDGYEVCRRIRADKLTSHTPIIILSNKVQINDRVAGFEAGADDYLTHPFNARELLARVKAMLLRSQRSKTESTIGSIVSTKAYDVFLSYSRKDLDLMQNTRDLLRANGLRVWTDEALKPGTPAWEKAIEQAIETTTTLVVLLSPDSKQSTWVVRELSYAEDQEVRIFPLLVRGDPPHTAVPLRLTSTQRIDARNNFDGAIQELIDAVRRYCGLE